MTKNERERETGWRVGNIDFSNASQNSKTLNAIFYFVDCNQFHFISTCKMAEEAWDTLLVAHKRTSLMKFSKLQILTLKFEQLTRRADEQFKDFYAKLDDITYPTYTLGKKYSECKIVKKIFKSLPVRFYSKVTATEDGKHFKSIMVEELVGSLMTYDCISIGGKKWKRILSFIW